MAAKTQTFVPAPPPDDEPIPDLREAVETPGDRMKLARMFQQHHSLGAEISSRKKQRDKITADIKALLGKHKVAKLQYEDLRVNYFCVPRETLSKQDLLDHDVSPDVIEACTRITNTYTLVIKQVGGEEED